MKLALMVLEENSKTKESNKQDSFEKIAVKLTEEYTELMEAIEEGDNKHIAEETWDIIQVTIRALALLRERGMDLEELNYNHNKKLTERGWVANGFASIKVR